VSLPAAAGARDSVGSFRSVLVACQRFDRPDARWQASLRLRLSYLSVTVEPTAATVDQFAEQVRKRLRRQHLKFDKLYPMPVAGFPDGRGRWVVSRRQRGSRQFQMYAVSAGLGIIVTAAEVHASRAQAAGPIEFEQAPVPALLPVTRLPGIGPQEVEERLTVRHSGFGQDVKLTALVTSEPVRASPAEFASGALATLQQRMPGLAVGEPAEDIFLGGYPCVRRTLLNTKASLRAPTLNEYWWAGVAQGRGAQLFVGGTKSIVDLVPASQARDLIMIATPG
jgi:hypothetical protein